MRILIRFHPALKKWCRFGRTNEEANRLAGIIGRAATRVITRHGPMITYAQVKFPRAILEENRTCAMSAYERRDGTVVVDVDAPAITVYQGVVPHREPRRYMAFSRVTGLAA